MTDIGWGHLAQFEGYGKAGDKEEDFDIIPYSDAKSEVYTSFKHASHAMLFCRSDAVLWELYEARASILVIPNYWMCFYKNNLMIYPKLSDLTKLSVGTEGVFLHSFLLIFAWLIFYIIR